MCNVFVRKDGSLKRVQSVCRLIGEQMGNKLHDYRKTITRIRRIRLLHMK